MRAIGISSDDMYDIKHTISTIFRNQVHWPLVDAFNAVRLRDRGNNEPAETNVTESIEDVIGSMREPTPLNAIISFGNMDTGMHITLGDMTSGSGVAAASTVMFVDENGDTQSVVLPPVGESRVYTAIDNSEKKLQEKLAKTDSNLSMYIILTTIMFILIITGIILAVAPN